MSLNLHIRAVSDLLVFGLDNSRAIKKSQLGNRNFFCWTGTTV